MKKRVIIGLLLALSISLVGCGDNNVSQEDNNVSQEDANSGKDDENSEEENDEDDEENNEDSDGIDTTIKISDEKMIEIYETAMPAIREVFEGMCPEPLIEKYGAFGDAPDPNLLTAIQYTDYDNNTINEASILTYCLAFDDNGSATDIRGAIDLNCDVSKIASEGFKFEESALYPVVEALIGTGHDYSEVNEQVQKYYQGDGDRVILFDDGYFGFSIDCSDDGLYFGYSYYAKRSE